jgi:hypothetical protein
MCARIAGLIVFTAGAFVQPQNPGQDPASSQPSPPPQTQPVDGSGTLRRPEQVDILSNLLGERARAKPILPEKRESRPGAAGRPVLGPDGLPVLAEGTIIVERPGRMIREGGRTKFVFHVPGEAQKPRTVEIVSSQLLEAMEKEAEAGFSEFIVSGTVLRYHDVNSLLLTKILRRVSNGNVGP